MRDRLDEELTVQTIRTLIQQEELARKQRQLEPWKLVIATAAVFAALGVGIGRAIYGA